MADWTAMKSEYATTQISYRKLAQKHGVSMRTLAERAKAEGWVAARERFRSETVTKSIDLVSSRMAERAARIQDAADSLLGKVDALLKDSCIDHDTKAMRDISVILKDIKEIQNVRADIDLREQEARIANLRRQAEAGKDDTGGVVVTLEGGLDEYAG